MKENIKSYKEDINVIIAEDDPDHRELMCRSLEKSKFFNRIECVYSGDVCLGRIASGDYDIAVIDYKIPKINGLEILKTVVQRGLDIPVVIVTGMGDERIAVEVMKEGAYDYIPKTGDLMYTLPHILNRALERYFLKKEFQRQEDKMRVMVQNLPVMAGALNDKFEITMWNRECERVTGYTAEEVIGTTNVIEMLLPEKQNRRMLLKLFSTRQGEFRDLEIIMTCKDGSLKTVSWSSMPKHYKYADGGTWAVGVDITEMKKADEAIRESESKYRLLADNVHDVIWTMDFNLHVTYITPSIEKLRGYPAEEVLSQRSDQIMTPASAERSVKMFREQVEKIKNGTFVPVKVELEFLHKNGSIVYAESAISVLYDMNRQPAGILGLTRDIGDRKKLQEQLIHSEKLSAVGQLAAGVAHEFNNLLTVIMGRAQLAIEEDSPAEMRKSLLEIEKKTKQGGNLVKNLGVFARPNRPRFQAQDISDVVDEVIKLQKRQLQLENIEVVREYRKHSKVLFDWSQIEQVFLNLLINAMHAIRPIGRGTIAVSVRDVDKRVEIRFSDTGTGMDEETRMKVFEPFFTTKGAWSVDGLGIPGTGLGLSISHSIIKEHSGVIDVESARGAGTTFIIYLPACGEAPEEEAPPAERRQKDDIGELKNLNILVVDDEEDMVLLMKLLFRKAGFLNVRIEGGAERALAAVRDFPPDIVFVDVLMPHMNGEQFFDEVQKIKSDIPVVFMTGKLDIDSKRYLNRGACAFIQKPFDIRDIVDLLKKKFSGRTI